MQASVARQSEPDDDYDEDTGEDEDAWSDGGLVEALETLELADGYSKYSFEYDNTEQ